MTLNDTTSEGESLESFLKGRPALSRLTNAVTDFWPEHSDYLAKSYAARTPDLLDTSEAMAAIVLRLAGDDISVAAKDYCWLCARVREEEIEFARTDAYRFSTFAEADEHVYSDDVFMRRYMHGLLFSHVLWYMHASSLHFFRQRLAARLMPGGRVMEVGSGHGLLLFLALTELGMNCATAWDISPVSLDQTRAALAKLGTAERVEYAIQDMHKVDSASQSFDLIILSHLLEHLEEPVEALQKLKRAIRKGGYVFVNIPLNAPMPDHLQLLRTPEEAEQLLVDGGFRVLELASHTTQATPLPRALKRKFAVTCSIIAEPA